MNIQMKFDNLSKYNYIFHLFVWFIYILEDTLTLYAKRTISMMMMKTLNNIIKKSENVKVKALSIAVLKFHSFYS